MKDRRWKIKGKEEKTLKSNYIDYAWSYWSYLQKIDANPMSQCANWNYTSTDIDFDSKKVHLWFSRLLDYNVVADSIKARFSKSNVIVIHV